MCRILLLKIYRMLIRTISCYALNLKDRYTKELLLQKHNFALYKAYYKLRFAGFKVYSAKTAAFTIGVENEGKAKHLRLSL